PILNEHDWLPLSDEPNAPGAEGRPANAHRQQGDRRDDDQRSRYRRVALRDALLHQIAQDDEEDDVERLERAEFAPSSDPRYQEDEEEDDGGADDQIHVNSRKDREGTVYVSDPCGAVV